MPRKPRSYAWANHLDASPVPLTSLSQGAYDVLRCAKVLADEAKTRSLQSFVRDGIVALTDQEVADHFGMTVDVMRRRVNKARRELFGSISDAAIIKRAQRQKARKKRAVRHCQEHSCGRRLGPLTHASRRYCDEHRIPSARTRRHRQQR